MTDPVFHDPTLRDRLGDRPAAGGGDGAAAEGLVVTLPAEEARHAAVKRIAVGESVVVTDGAGTAVRGRWRDGAVEVTEVLPPHRPRPRVTVVQAVPKSERAELAVDLAVQAGADRIVPWEADRCIARWSGKPGRVEKARAKWATAALAAMKQSRRTEGAVVAPLLGDVADLGTVLDAPPWAEAADPGEAGWTTAVLVLHEAAAVPFARAVADVGPVDELVLVVGPEGGVSDREVDVLAGTHGATAVVLGPEVLRTASAAAVALGALGVLTARWGRAPGPLGLGWSR
ncbi:16S rRNA (uracil(1498)-N(3))-methyltransferase [Corynebacterium bovis]|uniref:Ribosomal RNA small subunit methyltransferase E n=1 Tax=Corynebacterium bovis TaxID=36808 RepID=A0A3R8VV64_9CORY|nr:16S rRNA (uracil(1498)-N(3))-methyltransferase [Corynebacterium bovis]MDN8579117.1 16S rRNA (uracil(1498)-N(3))-methyltransferase [Corynebacterium bovis]RRO87660.1 16S rRNA (uracil(1498)-N(3))-methyltransferase [Corynebacterium bovis]RRO89020.1 16S rRNA (uracil(1498)-N(3))-methyltransferase [Corynebacterium bovis]